ncbi:MAG: hypothetical protein AAF824_06295 [Bacteroidota bacterium]
MEGQEIFQIMATIRTFIFLGTPVFIAYFVGKFIYKTRKAKYEAMGGNSELKEEIQKLLTSNKTLEKRVESLEAIIVDNDMNDLETGLSSKMEEREDASISTTITLDKDINL